MMPACTQPPSAITSAAVLSCLQANPPTPGVILLTYIVRYVLAQAPKSAMSSYDSGERSYRLGAYGGSSLSTPGGGAAVPLAEQDAEKRRLEVLPGSWVGQQAW